MLSMMFKKYHAKHFIGPRHKGRDSHGKAASGSTDSDYSADRNDRRPTEGGIELESGLTPG